MVSECRVRIALSVSVMYNVNDARKYAADQYAGYKWLGRKFIADRYAIYQVAGSKVLPFVCARGFFALEGNMKKRGFYIVKNVNFIPFPCLLR